MSKRTDPDLLRDIREAVERILSYAHKVSYNEFMRDMKTQDAVVRNLEIIGEAAKGISPKLKSRYKSVA